MIDCYRTRFEGLVEIRDPPEVWTPEGAYSAPNFIARRELRAKMALGEACLEVEQMVPEQRLPTAGEFYQITKRLRKTDPEIADSMLSGNSKRTSTILDYRHGRRMSLKRGREYYFTGLLIQVPEVDGNGKILKEKGGIPRAIQSWEMPLPLESGYIGKMDPIFDRLLDTLHGMKNARKRHPKAFLSITPRGLVSVTRSGWYSPQKRVKRIDMGTIDVGIPSRLVSAWGCAKI